MRTRRMQRFDRTRDFVVAKPFKLNGKPLQAGLSFHIKSSRISITPAKARALFEAGFIRHPEDSVSLPSPYLMPLKDGSTKHLSEFSYKELQDLVAALGLKVNKNKQDMQRQVCVHFIVPFPIDDGFVKVEEQEEEKKEGDDSSVDDSQESNIGNQESDLEQGESQDGAITLKRDTVGIQDGGSNEISNS